MNANLPSLILTPIADVVLQYENVRNEIPFIYSNWRKVENEGNII